jgi:hypothetical protein
MEVVRCFEIHQIVRIITDNVPFLAEVVLKWMVCCNQLTNTHRASIIGLTRSSWIGYA